MKYDLSFLELELRELLKKLKKHNTYASQLENEIILYKLENDKLKSIINKAIEYIEENEVVDYNPTLDGSENDSYMKLPRNLSLFNEGLDILLDILTGVDKE